jgi:GNAT superfamily N-acetyltransferase
MQLPDGYSDVPAGKIASVVTCLEMRSRPSPRGERGDAMWKLRREPRPEPEWYRALYARVGTQWLWFSRLRMPQAELESAIHHPDVEVFALETSSGDAGLLELDYRGGAECELAFFGLSPDLFGQGAGRWLMNRALELAWQRPIERLWVHTCTIDHPAALAFYLRSGFTPYARRIEVADDPRLLGLAPRDAAPHVPIIGETPTA